MLDHDWVPRTRGSAGILGGHQTLAHVASRIVRAVVLDIELADTLDEAPGHLGERRLHASEPGVAALRRNLQRIEHRRIWRLRHIAHVRVPCRFTIAERADRLALLIEHVRNDVDLWIVRRGLAPRTLVAVTDVGKLHDSQGDTVFSRQTR